MSGRAPDRYATAILPNSNIEVLNARAVAAHVQRIKVVDIDMLAAIISFARPELGVRLALEDVAGLDEGLTQAELIVPCPSREICIAGGVRGVGL